MPNPQQELRQYERTGGQLRLWREAYIYILCDPRTLQPRYVGSTIDPHVRLSYHQNVSHSRRLGNWRRELKQEGLLPLMFVIETVDETNRQSREDYWIGYIGEELDLLNHICPQKYWHHHMDRYMGRKGA
jgi:GIY-YIG catalytic domain-containing protein